MFRYLRILCTLPLCYRARVEVHCINCRYGAAVQSDYCVQVNTFNLVWSKCVSNQTCRISVLNSPVYITAAWGGARVG